MLRNISGATDFIDHPQVTVCLSLLLCVCVLAQMLGAPVTLLSLLTTSDMLAGSVSEDFSVLPPVPELRPFSALCLRVDGHPIPHLPVLATSVFHPPLT
ncbi:MAG: hypothetical protein NDI90_01125 [Nitrospira sp. BO4]|nr:hypothetical protein [Nitrospira sp. BO4]